MLKYILKRLAFLPLVMFGVTVLLFTALQFLSPEMRASLYVKDPRQLAQLDAVIEKYHLRDPVLLPFTGSLKAHWKPAFHFESTNDGPRRIYALDFAFISASYIWSGHTQYWTWLEQVLHGDLGYSETAKMPVAEAIRAFFPATFELTVLTFFPIMIVGVFFGVLSAVYRDKLLDHVTRFVAITGYSLPSFVLGLVLLMVFYGHLHWFPPGRYTLETDMLVHSDGFRHWTGLLTMDCLLNGQWAAYADVAKHMVLPAATLLYISVALLLRITRSSMLEELTKDYVRTARAKGLPESVIIRKHALANALIPVVTLSSLLFIGLLGGVVITETVFDFPGIGRWGVQAAQQLDVPGVLGSTMLAATLFVMANLVSDILYAVVDPRIRVGDGGGGDAFNLFGPWVWLLNLVRSFGLSAVLENIRTRMTQMSLWFQEVIALFVDFLRSIPLAVGEIFEKIRIPTISCLTANHNSFREIASGPWKTLRRKPMSLLGFGIIGSFLAVAALAPVIAPPEAGSRDAYIIPQTGYSPDPAPPSKDHWFGTTEQQYDLYYGMVWGTRTAFKVAVKVVGLSVCIGVLLGGIAGFYGGWVDEILMRFTDVVLAFPDLVLAVVIVAILGPSLDHVMYSVMAVSWPSYARLMRGDVLSVKERDFVAAARALGASDARILFRHIVPNSIYPVLVVASLSTGSVVITAAALSFLGLGAPVGFADWGQLISLSRNWIMGSSGNPFAYWHTIFIPGIAIFLFVLGWNLLGDAVRDILDPRQK